VAPVDGVTRLVHLYTGDDGQTHFNDGEVTLDVDEAAHTISFAESPPGSSLDWHHAPHHQYVITLSGTLEFETRLGERCTIAPGDVLLAEDTTGGGHRWQLVDDHPWRRVYVTLSVDTEHPAP
jgi:quercetin dioxygenase-like cupin family protein